MEVPNTSVEYSKEKYFIIIIKQMHTPNCLKTPGTEKIYIYGSTFATSTTISTLFQSSPRYLKEQTHPVNKTI